MVVASGCARDRGSPVADFRGVWVLGLCLALGSPAASQVASPAQPSVERALAGLDAYMEKILQDWNAPGVAVGVVARNTLVFAKGYGYRDAGKKLPMTPKTLVQIASNTKLFTAVGAGLLVEDGKLEWDKPIPRPQATSSTS